MEENAVKRIMPQSPEAERSVIGSMLMDNESIATAQEIITSEDFYQRSYGAVYDAILELYNEGKPVDLVTLKERLVMKNVPPEVSSLEFVKDLFDTVPTSANIKYYSEIVAEKATLRRLIRTNESIANMCYAETKSVAEILEESEQNIFRIMEDRGHQDFKPIKEIALDVVDNIEKASRLKGNVTGIPTGFTDLDRMLSGLQNSDLILLAARPSMGKTALALNILQHVVFRTGKNAAIFSLEMSREQLVTRLFSLESQIDSQTLRTGKLKTAEWTRLIEASNTVGNSGLIIDDCSGITLPELRSRCRKYKIEYGIDLVVIDYLQLMSAGGRNESRQQEVSDISRALKGLARELRVPVIALSQLSRESDKREDHRPRLSDLRESGSIEQDADVVMFIYRDEVYNKNQEDNKGQAEVIVAKQRNGPIGTVELLWLADYTKFVSKERE